MALVDASYVSQSWSLANQLAAWQDMSFTRYFNHHKRHYFIISCDTRRAEYRFLNAVNSLAIVGIRCSSSVRFLINQLGAEVLR